MALSIDKENNWDVLEIPLICGCDKTWEDNTWLVEHLHQLANKIEEINLQVYSISIQTNSQYKSPRLIVKGLKRDKIVGIGNFGQKISHEEFMGLSKPAKWRVSRELMNVKWHCSDCGNLINEGKKPEYPKEGEIRICSHCEAILTRHMKSPVLIPFNYCFSIIEGLETWDDIIDLVKEANKDKNNEQKEN